MNAKTSLRVSAVVSGLLFAAGYFIVVVIPGGGNVSERSMTNFYNSDGRKLTAMALFFVLIAGCLAMIWFFNELRAQLPDTVLTRTASTIAVVGLAAVAIGAGILGAPAGALQNSDFAFVGAPTAEAFSQAGLGVMLGFGMYALAAATVLMSVAARKSAAFPGWLSIAGMGAGVIMLGSYIWLPGLIFPIWVIALGLVGAREPSRVAGRVSAVPA